MRARVYRFNLADRVDHCVDHEGFRPDEGQGTPGRVTARALHDGEPYYRVRWDDGYTEEPDDGPHPNWWSEDVLVPEETP